MGDQISSDTALASLERFVVDNDELLELEETIGRFNIFDALKLARVEIRHSNFLAWLLDPGESHGQSDLFLKAVLMDVLSMAPAEARPFSPVELDGVNLQGVDVRREWNHIDILITCQTPSFVVIVENKIDSGEHGSQLNQYEKIVRDRFPSVPRLCIFLTIEGDSPKDNHNYVPYTYADLFRVLSRCKKTFAGAIGTEMLVVLDHYLRLIGSRFMDDPKINELCRRIFKNHRQALELIFETVGTPSAGVINNIAQLIVSKPQWKLVTQTSHGVDFLPAEWLEIFPSIGKRKSFDPCCWVVLKIRMADQRCTSGASVWPTTNPEIREQVLRRLTAQPDDFGFKLFFKKKEHAGDQFTQIGGKHVIADWQDDEPDPEKILKAVEDRLNFLEVKLRGVAGVLSPIFNAMGNDTKLKSSSPSGGD